MKLEWRDVDLGHGPISTSVTAAETQELQRLAKDADVLEIGSAYGYSMIAMALAGANYVLAVDPHQALNSLEVLQANLFAYGLDGHRVGTLVGDSRVGMPALDKAGRRFDLIWIDGDHSAEMVTHDVEWALKLLRPGGALLVHDYDEDTCPGVREALDAWKPPPRVVDTLAIYGPGEW